MTTNQLAVKLYGQEIVDEWLKEKMELHPPPKIELDMMRPFIESFSIYKTTTRQYKSFKVPVRNMRVDDLYYSQRAEVVTVRFVLVKHFKEKYPHYSDKMIGLIFGKHRTTIYNAYEEVNNKLEIKDKPTVEAWQSLQEFLKQTNGQGK